ALSDLEAKGFQFCKGSDRRVESQGLLPTRARKCNERPKNILNLRELKILLVRVVLVVLASLASAQKIFLCGTVLWVFGLAGLCRSAIKNLPGLLHVLSGLATVLFCVRGQLQLLMGCLHLVL
ncbi:hypothetical protein Tco_1286209, partial [Tanacetum coccineum]